MSRVALNADVLNWAVERARLTFDRLEGRFPKIREWEAGESHPTLRQLESLAKATHTPLGYFFLDDPPEEQLGIPHFRTLDDEPPLRPSADLLETVHTMQQRQAWMREHLIEEGQDALPFVSSCRIGSPLAVIAQSMRDALALPQRWAARERTWTDALRTLRESMEAAGILVVVNGIVGNNTHRKLDVEEFRGFVLIDEFAPLVFINGSDYKAAQLFTLAHELAHVFFGSSAAFDLRNMQAADDPTEQACNRVAAEFLVPESEIRQLWPTASQNAEPHQVVARHFKVSVLVAARRALDLELVSLREFLDFYREYQQDERRRAETRSEGGDFYANQNLRVGRTFASAVIQAAREGQLLYSQAYELTGLYGSTFDAYAQTLELRNAS